MFGTLRHKPSKANHMPNETSASLRDIAALFLKLGIIGFGGPAAHIAMMRQEVVEKRSWFDDRACIFGGDLHWVSDGRLEGSCPGHSWHFPALVRPGSAA